MENVNTATTQKERLASILLSLKQDITDTDRKDAVKDCGVSEPTLKRYLAGNIGDNDKAVELIRFFRKRIEQRDKAALAA